jgi:hypothetical protein
VHVYKTALLLVEEGIIASIKNSPFSSFTSVFFSSLGDRSRNCCPRDPGRVLAPRVIAYLSRLSFSFGEPLGGTTLIPLPPPSPLPLRTCGPISSRQRFPKLISSISRALRQLGGWLFLPPMWWESVEYDRIAVSGVSRTTNQGQSHQALFMHVHVRP